MLVLVPAERDRHRLRYLLITIIENQLPFFQQLSNDATGNSLADQITYPHHELMTSQRGFTNPAPKVRTTAPSK